MARSRFAPILLASLFLVAAASLSAQTPADDTPLQNTLALQQAMAQAKQFLYEGNNRKAVEALEEQLSRVNGHAGFLKLLRDAYRAYITDLWVANQPQAAKRYLERLCILEPAAAQDPTLRPPDASQTKFNPEPKEPPKSLLASLPFPNFGQNQKKADKTPAQTASAQNTASNGDAKPSVARGKIEDPNEDPFAPIHMRNPGLASQTKLALDLVAQAEEEFTRRRFPEARTLFEKAYQVDKNVVQASRERWAYCVLNHVVEQLNKPGLGGESLATLQQHVHNALTLAPGLADTGKWLLKEIDQRHRTSVAAAGPDVNDGDVQVKHLGKNAQGWLVAETDHFRIFHHQAQDLADKVAQIAERTRRSMYRKWFGTDAAPWNPKCELILHSTGAEYTKMTGVPATSPGHSRIESDPSGQRIIARRMDLRCDAPGFLEAVLPHETTHVVLAGMFGKHAVPRWADEGIAVLTEPTYKIEQHRRNLNKASQDGTLFGVKELMQLNDYPQPRRISAFYAQSVCLVEYLMELKSPRTLTAFIADGLNHGYDTALQKHYGLTMGQLEQRWQQHVAGGASKVASAP